MVRSVRVWVVAVLVLLASLSGHAESVATLPPPTNYVNDFAGVLSPATVQSMDALCRAVDRQAHAQIAVVTIHTIDPDKSGATPTIEEFATALEDKWKVGAKGTDRGVLMLLVMSPRRGRIEVGYGLEGILNDARVGDIGRAMVPDARKNDYNDAVTLGVKDLAGIIAADAGVTLSTAAPAYQTQLQPQPRSASMSLTEVLILGGSALFILILLASTGHLGLLFWFLLNMMGGGRGGGGGFGGGGGGGGDDSFGGFGGGSSGGGGASGDF